MISIIIPFYNQAEELDKCLLSIQKQSYKNYEIILVNDRSTKRMRYVVDKHKSAFGFRMTLAHNQTNHGAPYSRNKGFRLSKGEYVIFCDADVVMHPLMLEAMREALKDNPDASFAYSSYRFGFKKFKLFPFDKEILKKQPYIHSASLIKRVHFPEKGWDESLKRMQDWDLWLTMMEEGRKGVWIDSFLFKVIPGGTMSSWMPGFFYSFFPFLPKVRKYKEAVRIVAEKHNLKK